MHFPVNLVLLLVAGNFQIVACLKGEPKLRSGAEEAGKSQSHLSRNSPLPPGDFIDTRGRHAQLHCQLVRIEAEWLHKLLTQNLAGMDGLWSPSHVVSSLVRHSTLEQKSVLRKCA